MVNEKVKERARISRIPLWEIAQQLGVCEATIQRWLRCQLSVEKEVAINEAIDRIVERRNKR